jgi:TRAP-type mannitol/chloroaromatic compound transport system permease small subunit
MIRAIERAVDLLGRATSWLALAIVVLMATNVVLRYLFSYGSVWAQELEWHLLAPLILFAIAYALQKGEHVRVDVMYARFSPRGRAGVNIVEGVLCLAISLLIVWISLHYVQQSYVIDEKSADPGGLTHRWVLKALIPAGFVLVALQSVAEIVKSIARFRQAGR